MSTYTRVALAFIIVLLLACGTAENGSQPDPTPLPLPDVYATANIRIDELATRVQQHREQYPTITPIQ